MFILRMLGGWAIVVAIIAFVYDVTVALNAGTPIAFTNLGRHWFWLSSGTLNLVQASLERYVHPVLWDPMFVSVLKLPTWVFFLGLAVLLYLAGRRRRKVEIFAN